MSRVAEWIVPVALGIAVLAAWEFLVGYYDISHVVLPAPSGIAKAFITQFDELMQATWVTFRITALAFALAVIGGVALAILFVQSRTIEAALFPYAVIMQVTPVVAIAPIITIWIGYDRINLVLLVLAWIVAFFPILANTTLGLRSTDHNLIDLFRLYGASRWQILWRLQLPSALPYVLGAMKVSGGLALIGSVVAEFAAGSGTATGLAWLLTLATRNLHMETAFAALALLAILGIAIFSALSLLEWALLHRWHESALEKQT
jgi:NitT/TauT family transport system permease protein